MFFVLDKPFHVLHNRHQGLSSYIITRPSESTDQHLTLFQESNKGAAVPRLGQFGRQVVPKRSAGGTTTASHLDKHGWGGAYSW